jgi:sigma-B regulation protein RsbU (phosphoserine phosphatase)
MTDPVMINQAKRPAGFRYDNEEIVDTKDLQQEISQLKKEKAVYKAQSRMLDHFVSVARDSVDKKMIRATLQKTLDISIELTGAEKGSLFLLDENEVVIESILTRTQATPEESQQLVGKVLDQGLAGWVRHHCNITDGDCKLAYICDTQKDDRWVTLPEQPYEVRSALTVPITRKKRLFGLLTLIHSRPNHFDAESIELIEMAAVQIGVVLENVTLYAKLEESYRHIQQAKKEIEEYSRTLDLEMKKGRKIQQDFLPEQIPEIPGWEIEAFFHPAIQVSGDFYDLFELPNHHLGLILADVCDKGIGAALFMALFRSLIRVYTFGHEALAGPPYKAIWTCELNVLKAIGDTNSYIVRHHEKLGMFATIFAGVLNLKTGDLTYINAGHEPPLILSDAGKIHMLPPTGPAVGLLPKMNFPSCKAHIDFGDILIAYTDGVTEANSPSNKILGRRQLHLALQKPFSSALETIEQIKRETFTHIDSAPQNDDITLLCVRRKNIPF